MVTTLRRSTIVSAQTITVPVGDRFKTSQYGPMRRRYMRLLLFTFILNSTSAQWRVGTFSERHTTLLPVEHYRLVISKTTHFR